MEIAFSIFPVSLFLLFLFILDSFKLVIGKYLVAGVLWGCLSALVAYFVNSAFIEGANLKFELFSQYIAPAIEEMLKALFIYYILFKKRVGFMIDAAIYGFAVGAGFALIENIFYLYSSTHANMLTWIIRGLGTALMHGGCTSLFAIFLISGKNRESSGLLSGIIAFATAYIIHSAFNHFYINPIIQTIGITVIYPILFILIFRYNEIQLQNWLEIEFSSEIDLLNMINKGEFQSTHSGEYLVSLKSRFSPEVIFDMYCYIRIYLELSVKAKRNLMLKENGFPPIPEGGIDEKLSELGELRKRIGKVGELTLSPLIRMNYRDLWKLNSLK